MAPTSAEDIPGQFQAASERIAAAACEAAAASEAMAELIDRFHDMPANDRNGFARLIRKMADDSRSIACRFDSTDLADQARDSFRLAGLARKAARS